MSCFSALTAPGLSSVAGVPGLGPAAARRGEEAEEQQPPRHPATSCQPGESRRQTRAELGKHREPGAVNIVYAGHGIAHAAANVPTSRRRLEATLRPSKARNRVFTAREMVRERRRKQSKSAFKDFYSATSRREVVWNKEDKPKPRLNPTCMDQDGSLGSEILFVPRQPREGLSENRRCTYSKGFDKPSGNAGKIAAFQVSGNPRLPTRR